MIALTRDVAVIGAGTAGLAAERKARQAGASTILIDDRFACTTCTTVGCMPSKLLIAAGDAAHSVRLAPGFGIRVDAPSIDGPAVLARVRRERDRFVDGVKRTFAELPGGVAVQARASFIATTRLSLDDGTTVSARAIVIATGGEPNIPDTFATVQACLLTSDTLFDMQDLPASMAVIGAGSLGLEFAQALARLGVKVCVFDEGHGFAGLPDGAVATELQAILGREFTIKLGVALLAQPQDDGARLSWTGNDMGEQYFERVLLATGRKPQIEGLGLKEIGLRLDAHGMPHFDPSTMQCEGVPIFLAGDADGERAVLHEAQAEGEIAGANAARYPHILPSRRDTPFNLMFTDPPAAVIGETEAHAGIVVGCASYADQGRAKIEMRNAGLVRLYAERGSGRLLGAVLAAPGADHYAHLIAWAIGRGQTAEDLLRLPIYHPTLEEGLKPALREIAEASGSF